MNGDPTEPETGLSMVDIEVLLSKFNIEIHNLQVQIRKLKSEVDKLNEKNSE